MEIHQILNTNKDNRFIQPYLFFNGNCEEAVEFYRKALGAEVEMTMRFKESPEPPPPGMVPPGFENKIMHTSFEWNIGGLGKTACLGTPLKIHAENHSISLVQRPGRGGREETEGSGSVRERVRKGGHNVPVADIRRRFKRSLAHLLDDYLPLATRWIVWDSRGLPAKRLAISGENDIGFVRKLIGV